MGGVESILDLNSKAFSFGVRGIVLGEPIQPILYSNDNRLLETLEDGVGDFLARGFEI
jgi:hypothetical protein